MERPCHPRRLLSIFAISFWGDVSKANESIKTTVQCSGMQFIHLQYTVYIHTSLTTHHSTKG